MPVLFAHLMQTGFGGFYDGIAHVLITPVDLLVVLGLSLLAGQQGPAGGRLLLALLPLSWWLGGMAGLQLRFPISLTLLTTLLLILVGVLVALARRLKPSLLAGVVVVSGLAFGLANGFTLPAASGGLSLDLLGVVSAVTVLVLLISGQVAVTERAWLRIAQRVAGSWIAAAGLLALGLLLKA